jgi:hypothetical protein
VNQSCVSARVIVCRLRLSATLNAALRLAQSRQGVDDTLARILREQAFINC